jgi:hypothetical protein
MKILTDNGFSLKNNEWVKPIRDGEKIIAEWDSVNRLSYLCSFKLVVQGKMERSLSLKKEIFEENPTMWLDKIIHRQDS